MEFDYNLIFINEIKYKFKYYKIYSNYKFYILMKNYSNIIII